MTEVKIVKYKEKKQKISEKIRIRYLTSETLIRTAAYFSDVIFSISRERYHIHKKERTKIAGRKSG